MTIVKILETFTCRVHLERAGSGFSEPDFLAGCKGVARLAAPSVTRELEGTVILIAEERSGLMTPVASDHVRISEIRIRAEDAGGHLFLTGDQIVAAKDFTGRRSNDLSGQGIIQSLGAAAVRRQLLIRVAGLRSGEKTDSCRLEVAISSHLFGYTG